MFTAKLKTLVPALVVVALCAAAARAQQSQPTPGPADNYVTFTGFKNRVFDVRNRTPDDLIPVLKLLTSGFKGAQVSASNEFKTIVVRDFPENIAAIEDALKRLDTPEAARPDIELRIHVLIASNVDNGLSPLPSELKDVVTQLQSTLSFRNYNLLTSIVQRTKDSRGYHPGFLQGSGAAQATAPTGEKLDYNYAFEAHSLELATGGAGSSSVQLGNFNFQLSGSSGGGSARIHSDVSMREGEKIVVGTAGLRDKALILVMTAKIVK
ncbi:MAG TPA: secretin N-terminal domain-containing protein [Pyrinomonadaceae bacterium]|jgi:type II secretory pathway component GspD/PulD (secretin)|nr:secretin N-terminal domain-containing protein [Pyrinomonadaceae bacterium]